jgi:hypothetical protein
MSRVPYMALTPPSTLTTGCQGKNDFIFP